MQGHSRNRSGLFASIIVGKNLAYTSSRGMSLKRSLQDDTTGGEKADEKAAKRAKVDEKEETKNENNSDKDNVKNTAKAAPKPPVASAFGGIFSSGPTFFGKGGFGSASTDDASKGSSNSNSLGFGAVTASSTNSIFGKIDKSSFGSLASSSKKGISNFAKLSSNSSSFASFGSTSPSEKKNSIFSEKAVPVFGSEKSRPRALSPGLAEIDVQTGEEDEETVLATRAKLFEMQQHTVATADSGKTTDDSKKDDGKDKDEKPKSGDVEKTASDTSKVDAKKVETAAKPPVAYEWKIRGVGEIRLKEEKRLPPDSGKQSIRKQRLVMRREYGAGSVGGEVILNAQLNSDVKLLKENDSHLRLTSFDTNGKVVTHLIRIKRFKDLEDLFRKVQNYVERCKRIKENQPN